MQALLALETFGRAGGEVSVTSTVNGMQPGRPGESVPAKKDQKVTGTGSGK